jgi:hypothetical protein
MIEFENIFKLVNRVVVEMAENTRNIIITFVINMLDSGHRTRAWEPQRPVDCDRDHTGY